MFFLGLVIGLLAGGAAGWFIGRSRYAATVEADVNKEESAVAGAFKGKPKS